MALHSFELVRRRLPEQPQKVMRLHNHRFLELCRLLETNSDKFVSATSESSIWRPLSAMLDPAASAPRSDRLFGVMVSSQQLAFVRPLKSDGRRSSAANFVLG